MRIAICDDEERYISKIRELMTKCCIDSKKLDFYEFKNGEDFLLNYESGKYDIIVLDIEMDELSGLDVAKEIRKTDSTVIIAFLTSHQEFAVDGYEVNAFRYILKGQPDEMYIRQLTSIINEYKQTHITFPVQTKSAVYNISVSDIQYFEVYKRMIVVHSATDKYEFYGKISDIKNDERLIGFVKPHKSYYVNLAFIDHIEADVIIMSNGEKVLLSRNYKQAVTEQFLSYMTERY